MPDDFVIARNPDTASSLPYLVRLPLPSGAVVLKAREPWPRTSVEGPGRRVGEPADQERAPG